MTKTKSSPRVRRVATRRETLVRYAAIAQGLSLSEVATQMGYANPSGLFGAFRAKRPHGRTLAAILAWLHKHGRRDITLADIA